MPYIIFVCALTLGFPFPNRNKDKLRRRDRENQIATAQYHIAIAKNNLLYLSEYENTEQLIKTGKLEAAKVILQELWHYAPDYGDPMKLAKEVGVRAPLGRITLQTLKAYWVSMVLLMAVLLDFFLYFRASNWKYSQLIILILTGIAMFSFLPFFFEKDESHPKFAQRKRS